MGSTLFVHQWQVTPRLRFAVNWQIMAAYLLTVVLYPIYGSIQFTRIVTRIVTRYSHAACECVEAWYWRLDTALVQAGQVLAIAVVGIAAILISPVRIMA